MLFTTKVKTDCYCYCILPLSVINDILHLYDIYIEKVEKKRETHKAQVCHHKTLLEIRHKN